MNYRSILLLGISLFLFGLISCEDDDDENESNISTYNSSESHKAGQDCMNCHTSGGPGEGWFSIAGTVYDSTLNDVYPNATVKIYTEPNGAGTLKSTVAVDRNGNFYTTESIDFGSGIYVLVEGDLETKYMITPITTGRCNSCHGVTTSKIWTK